MTRVKVDDTMPVDDHYRGLINAAVKTRGGQTKVANAIDVNQATISRALSLNGRATYQTLAKLSKELDLPDPIVSVRDFDHEQWCKLGAVLAEIDHDQFLTSLQDLRRDVERARSRGAGSAKPNQEAVDKLKTVIAHPLPRRSRKHDRPG